jgi:hypothetical protein
MTKSVKNIAASVHQRLLDKAKESSRPVNSVNQVLNFSTYFFPDNECTPMS